MPPESKFFGLDETAWTAIAAIIALALGLYGAFWLKFLDWLRKPVLALEFSKMDQHSERMEDFWCLRVPVSNGEGRNPATHIEVFLESIQRHPTASRHRLSSL